MSVRLRLTLLYALLMAVTLIISSLILYVVLDQTMTSETDAFLRSKAQDLGASIQVIGGPGTFWVRLPDLDRFAEADVYVQALDENGSILDQSVSMGGYSLPLDPKGVAAGIAGQIDTRTVTIRGLRVRVITVPLRLQFEPPSGPFHILQVGRDFGRIESTLTMLQRALLIGDARLVV